MVKRVTVIETYTCTSCNGNGIAGDGSICGSCNGTGTASVQTLR